MIRQYSALNKTSQFGEDITTAATINDGVHIIKKYPNFHMLIADNHLLKDYPGGKGYLAIRLCFW